jgi:putative ABC transport system permease protein
MHLLTDIRYALRQLRKTPGFSVVAILTLALGIGANTAMFSVVDAVLVRPLPYADPDRLVMLWEDASRIGFPHNTPSPANWQIWRSQTKLFSDVAATKGGSFLVSGGNEPEHLSGRLVTASFWAVLGALPIMGRTFTEDEDRRKAPVAVISHGLWQRRFGGARDVVGSKLILNDSPVTVIGVMSRDFYFLPWRFTDIWTPAAFSPQELSQSGNHYLNCVARLKPGVSLNEARQAMTALGHGLMKDNPYDQSMPVLVPLREELAGKTQTSLIVLLCASACVLLISCANLANLLLARAASREREVAVRSALGAGRGRLMAQFLTESLVLAGLGAAAGLAAARPAMQFLETLVPTRMVAMHLRIDWRVLAFSASIAVISGIVFGMVPALSASRVQLQASLKEGGRGMAGSRRHWFQHSLIVAETALAVVLLTGGGLLLQTLNHLRQINLGIRTEKLLTALVPLTRYRDFNKRVAFVDAMLQKIRAIPGVTSAGSISDIPLTSVGGTSSYQFAWQGNNRGQDALNRVVTRGYFETIGAQLREGRFFQDSDRTTKEPVAIVNETFADRHFPGKSALGARFQYSNMYPGAYWYTIVGVVKEIRERGVSADLKPAVYIVNEQADQDWPVPSGLMIRTSGDSASIGPAVREAIWSVDSNQPIARMRTLDSIIDTELSEPSQDSALLAAFAALALVLASIGLYGVLSYAVTQRTSEIGVRMALGATSGNILRTFGRQGLLLTGIGLAVGLLLAMAATRLMTSLLFGFTPNYAPAVAAVSAILLVVAAVACFIPARRASRIDPLVALRHE